MLPSHFAQNLWSIEDTAGKNDVKAGRSTAELPTPFYRLIQHRFRHSYRFGTDYFGKCLVRKTMFLSTDSFFSPYDWKQTFFCLNDTAISSFPTIFLTAYNDFSYIRIWKWKKKWVPGHMMPMRLCLNDESFGCCFWIVQTKFSLYVEFVLYFLFS